MTVKELKYHIPALFGESIEGLNIKPEGVYVDATFGGGGHSRGILAKLGNDGRLYSFDQDADAGINRIDDSRFTFVRGNFRYLSNFMRYYKEAAIDGLIADLGMSSHHLDDETRGFSFRFDGVLDMRMNNCGGQTAADVLNKYPEERLAEIFYLYGELRNSRKIASAVVKARDTAPIRITSDLLKILMLFSGKEKEKKFLAQVFQSLRIEVNQEMQALRELLPQSLKLLKPDGRLVVITYHSLEDRMVKNFMKTGNLEGLVVQNVYGNVPSPLHMLSRAVPPSKAETDDNPRARSAKLRIAEKRRHAGSGVMMKNIK
ncbi:MAG: 16S rRNA (cytosine(1402)-N(4))-methyltransferase RsmH [Tannerella sp.]|jgi:16S rRNA (cytosine1402-N4)-methyltransferase|nr:16S rRNA (cytosine(1402)-N(4))-methyltransferase RsmH [Tannerella sp.]